MVSDFAKVFPDEVPKTPPAREVEDLIDLVLGILPISKEPYRMVPVCSGSSRPIYRSYWNRASSDLVSHHVVLYYIMLNKITMMNRYPVYE